MTRSCTSNSCCTKPLRFYTAPSPNKCGSKLERNFVPVEFNGLCWTLPDRYSDLTSVGSGAFGVVCSAKDNLLQRMVAIKRIDKPFDTLEDAKRTYRELAIMAHMDHENVVTLVDAFTPQATLESFNEIFFVMPLMAGDLAEVLKHQVLDDDQITFLVYQILRALKWHVVTSVVDYHATAKEVEVEVEVVGTADVALHGRDLRDGVTGEVVNSKYMHGANIIHRDLKPKNIAVDEDCNLRILDFGLARPVNENMSSYVVTRWYRAPELIANWINYNDTVDVWSVACILVEMKIRRPLFRGDNPMQQLGEILAVVGLPDEGFRRKISSDSARAFIKTLNLPPRRDLKEVFPWASDVLLDLLSKMLVLDPDRRLRASEALAHPFFAEYHDANDEQEGTPLEDELISSNSLTIDQWKEATWNFLRSYRPRNPPSAPNQAERDWATHHLNNSKSF
ncbi:Mitogen-activated protein kinase 11 [Echinococcus granulosus]|nr:Mitogen-activated protein kinase 11 [Echinococcus granulosus]